MNRRILYISPNRELAGAVAHATEPISVEVDHARGLAQGLALLRRTPYAAIVTDASLGDGTWRDVLAHTHRSGRGCAVIVTDRLADDELWAEVLEAGAYDLLAQPFEPDEVRRVVENACIEFMRVPPQHRSPAYRTAV